MIVVGYQTVPMIYGHVVGLVIKYVVRIVSVIVAVYHVDYRSRRCGDYRQSFIHIRKSVYPKVDCIVSIIRIITPAIIKDSRPRV